MNSDNESLIEILTVPLPQLPALLGELAGLIADEQIEHTWDQISTILPELNERVRVLVGKHPKGADLEELLISYPVALFAASMKAVNTETLSSADRQSWSLWENQLETVVLGMVRLICLVAYSLRPGTGKQ